MQDKHFWKPDFEKLLPSTNAPVPSSVQAPKLDLKPLPSNLKYAFLGENETFLVIISSKLDLSQKDKLIETLRMHKNKNMMDLC